MIVDVSSVRYASRADLPAVADLLGEAFDDDPFAVWLFPERDSRRERMAAFFAIVAGASFEHGHVYVHDGGAAAIWSPPEVEAFDDAAKEAIATLCAEAISDEGHLWRVYAGLESLDAGHPSESPHFYLAFMGSRVRGSGYGTALLNDMLTRCDEQGMSAYLEASSRRNRPLYERHGFETFEEFRFPDGPPVWRMWRNPQN